MAENGAPIPEGWVAASMMQGTHTIDEDGNIEPYTVPFKGSLVEIADALIKLRLKQIHRVGHPRFQEAQRDG